MPTYGRGREGLDLTGMDAAVKTLRQVSVDAYLWHSGGGIVLARVDFANSYVLISEACEIVAACDDRWYVGYYPNDDADGSIHRIVSTDEELAAAVAFYRACS